MRPPVLARERDGDDDDDTVAVAPEGGAGGGGCCWAPGTTTRPPPTVAGGWWWSTVAAGSGIWCGGCRCGGVASSREGVVAGTTTMGDSSVGKTSLIDRFVNDHFEDIDNKPTLGDSGIKTVTIDGHPVEISIRDTGGEERFGGITSTCNLLLSFMI
ncbi:hypothetical protein Pelo_17960 [Pelomyxa schiedti]|nr:hypothetical protein Pelo_17960 [Pelomyxa schiedti]